MDEQPKLRHGGLGISSFVIAIIALIFIILLFGVAGAVRASGRSTPAVDTVVGLAMLLAWVADLIGIGLGIAGALDKRSKKTFPILGLVIGLGTIILTGALVLIGLSMH
jgi:cation transport ATPase